MPIVPSEIFYNDITHYRVFHVSKHSIVAPFTKDDNGVGRGGRMGIFIPASHDFVLLHPYPAPHDGKNFLTPFLPLKAPSHLVKLYFLLIFPTTSTIFINETYFINKNILEIITKFISSNQINF